MTDQSMSHEHWKYTSKNPMIRNHDWKCVVSRRRSLNQVETGGSKLFSIYFQCVFVCYMLMSRVIHTGGTTYYICILPSVVTSTSSSTNCSTFCDRIFLCVTIWIRQKTNNRGYLWVRLDELERRVENSADGTTGRLDGPRWDRKRDCLSQKTTYTPCSHKINNSRRTWWTVSAFAAGQGVCVYVV